MSRADGSYLTGKFRKAPYKKGTCPSCGGVLPAGYPAALSRRDGKTEICSACGTLEAMEDVLSAEKRKNLKRKE